MMDTNKNLPVPVLSVLEHPHWRINLRPNFYQKELIPTLSKCLAIIRKSKLSLRGWDYPHLSNRNEERGHGKNWVASWTNFMSHIEYWRLYQSGQFLHLSGVRESIDSSWRNRIQENMKTHLSQMDEINWEKVAGFLSIKNFIYTITEIFEFTARLCEIELYKGPVKIIIELKDIDGFVLSADLMRSWDKYYSANEPNLGNEWIIDSDDLLANVTNLTLKAIIWFFERFGWLNPSSDVIRQDINNFLKGQI